MNSATQTLSLLLHAPGAQGFVSVPTSTTAGTGHRGRTADFDQELLRPDLDRIETHVADALARVPVAAEPA